MANAKKTLSKFTINPTKDAFSLHIEDDAGEVIEFEATPEQLDLIAEAIEDLLGDDDAAEDD